MGREEWSTTSAGAVREPPLPTTLTEATVEAAALAYLESLGWTIAHGPDIAAEERTSYGQVVLEQRLRNALARLNPSLPASALDDAFRQPGLFRQVRPAKRAIALFTGCWWMA